MPMPRHYTRHTRHKRLLNRRHPSYTNPRGLLVLARWFSRHNAPQRYAKHAQIHSETPITKGNATHLFQVDNVRERVRPGHRLDVEDGHSVLPSHLTTRARHRGLCPLRRRRTTTLSTLYRAQYDAMSGGERGGWAAETEER